VFVDQEAHLGSLDSKSRRLEGHQELHRAWVDHIGGELGIIGAHGEAIVEFLALESHLLATPAAPDREQRKREWHRDRGQDLGVIFGDRAGVAVAI
jgi:hypothetical protein